ncbi:MAG: 50S ribosomal protein L29 [Deltaproteobacteria bacterium]|nr:50S ribosomal protein L29 [Deltaproteobacteria bacterium]
MKAADLRELTMEELQVKMRELSEELFKLNFQHATQQLDNTARLREARKNMARIKTVLQERTG